MYAFDGVAHGNNLCYGNFRYRKDASYSREVVLTAFPYFATKTTWKSNGRSKVIGTGSIDSSSSSSVSVSGGGGYSWNDNSGKWLTKSQYILLLIGENRCELFDWRIFANHQWNCQL